MTPGQTVSRDDLNALLCLAAMLLASCAYPRACKPLAPIKIGATTIYPAVCPDWRMDDDCGNADPNTHVNACTYRKRIIRSNDGVRTNCVILAADTEAGKAASYHEMQHCAGADENGARCDDWPGTTGAPPGQVCVKSHVVK